MWDAKTERAGFTFSYFSTYYRGPGRFLRTVPNRRPRNSMGTGLRTVQSRSVLCLFLKACGALLPFVLCLFLASVTASAQSAPAPETSPQESYEVHKLAVGESQVLSIQLLAHQAVEIDIEQLNGQVSLQWRDQSGNESQSLFTLDGAHGHIRAVVVADQAGEWRFKIATRRGRAAEYRVQCGNARPATNDDVARASATNALALGEALRAKSAKANAAAAEKAYQESIVLWQKAGDGCGVRATLNGLGHLQIALGQYAAAKAASERALAEKCADLPSKAHSLRILQAAVQWAGDLDGSIRIGDEALKIYQETGDLAFQGLILGNLSGAYDQEGATGQAMDAARQALELARKTGDLEGIVFDEETIGGIHLQRGEYQLALEQFNRTLEDLKTHQSPIVQALVEDDLGNVYSALGDQENALAEFKRSQATANSNANPSTELDALVDEGNLHLARKEHSEAEAAFSRALAIAVDKEVTQKRAKALRGVGAAEVGAGNLTAGLQKLLAARELARSFHDDFTEIAADLDLGDYYFARGDLPKAEEAYGQLRELAEQSRSSSQLAVAWASLARVSQASGDLASARIDAENALTTIEDQRGQINAPDLRSSFFQSTRSYYDLYVQILMGLEKKANDPSYARLALAAAENSRARALTDLLSEQSINVKNRVSPEFLSQRGQALDALHAAAYRVNRLPTSASKKEHDALNASVREAKQSLDEVEGQIRAVNRRFSDLVRPAPLTVDEIQNQLLDANAVLLEYWLSEKESYLWAVTADSVHSFRLPAEKHIDTLSSRLRVVLASWSQLPPGVSLEQKTQYDAATAAEIARLSGQLGAILLKPALSTLGNKNVVLVSDGSLRGVPFGFLPLNQKATLESRNTVTYLPSVGSLRWLRKDPYRSDGAQALAVFADPVFSHDDPRLGARSSNPGGVLSADATVTRAMRDSNAADLSRLVWSRREAQSIASSLPQGNRWLALDFAANRSSVMNTSWEPYGVVHFATHTLIDQRSPELSGIVLSLYNEQGEPIDGFLRVTDIYSLTMPAQLVVLSTCDSAADVSGAGNDTYTLANAFFYAGAPRILASLWTVDDRAAAAFMSHFYRALLVRRASPGVALRLAKQAMSQDPHWHAPYYWSGFVLEGDWR